MLRCRRGPVARLGGPRPAEDQRPRSNAVVPELSSLSIRIRFTLCANATARTPRLTLRRVAADGMLAAENAILRILAPRGHRLRQAGGSRHSTIRGR